MERVRGGVLNGMEVVDLTNKWKKEGTVLELTENKRVEGRRCVVGTDQKLKGKTVGAKQENC
jgi:hypothetical protein